MTNTIRIYVYGVGEEKEFLRTFLRYCDAKKYCDDHQKVFPGRFNHYLIGEHRSNIWEKVNEY